MTGTTKAASQAAGIAGLQLSQLRVLDALYKDRSVHRAAARLCITSSAVSHALKKLREAIGDELFTRRSDGMHPTPRAHEIAPALHEALGLLQSALTLGDFDPAVATRQFRIVCLLSLRIAAGPYLARLLCGLGAGVSIEFQQIGTGFVEDLERGRIDLAISTVGKTPPWMHSALILEESMVFAIRKDHPRGKTPLSVAELATFRHVEIQTTDFRDRGLGLPPANGEPEYALQSMEQAAMTAALAETSLTVSATMIVPDTITALAIVKATDMIALCPRRVAQAYGDRGEIIMLEPPYPNRPTPMRMIWNARQQRDSAHIWLRKTIMDIAHSMPVSASHAEDPIGK
jgi:DNA-binding transcriptional LysR family regulator